MYSSPIKLKHVLILPFIILMSLAVLITSYLTWKYNEETTTHLGDQISQQSAFRIEEKLDYYLQHARTSNDSVKHVIQHGLIDANNRAETLEYISHIVKQQSIGTLSFAYPDGSYMGISNAENGKTLKKIASIETDRVFYTYEMPSETIIQQKPNYDARVRPWFIEAKANKGPIWSSVFELYSNNKLGVTYSEALYNLSGDFLGVVGTDVILHDLDEQLHKIRLTDHSYLFIVDDENHVIAQSDLSETHGNQALYKINTSDNQLLKDTINFINRVHPSPTTPLHSDSTFTVNGNTEDYFVNFIPYGHGQGLDWYIGVVIPKSDFMGHIDEVRRNTFIVWLISFISSIVLGLSITYMINQSIKRLHSKLAQIEANGHMYEHEQNPVKEVNDLSLAFSLMSKRLYESYLDLTLANKDLESIISKRTDSLKKANNRLKQESNTDSLTSLANRRSFDYFIDYYWDSYESQEIENLTLLMCDLDFFKQYNDIYGHLLGDECLKQFAKVIESSVREIDIATRYGGEEFAIIMPNVSAAEGITIAKRIIKNLTKQEILHEGSSVAKYVTTSIGIASTSSQQTNNKTELINRADMALLQAKSDGKNRYIIDEN